MKGILIRPRSWSPRGATEMNFLRMNRSSRRERIEVMEIGLQSDGEDGLESLGTRRIVEVKIT